ncbi:Ig-like domain-containing protein [uncultured Rhodospira sp.]|uniref:Ig-like domain-containing protein n=1 Tax=uncultured Rhodospira sp. TaxID=1936189 RepID=UPI0026369C8A|nr:Ig-like domain-containing protein [uncultured Rhodospira sp.]
MSERVLWSLVIAACVLAVAILSWHLVTGSDGPSRQAEAPPPAETVPPPAAPSTTGDQRLDRVMEEARETLSVVDAPDGPEAEATAPGAETSPPAVTAEAPAPSDQVAAVAPRVRASGAPSDPAAPRFDVVRVEADGSAVMAGRAEPGARVSILDAGSAIGEVTADARGEWVFVPDAPLAAGDRELSLVARADGAGTAVTGSGLTASAGGGTGGARRSERVVVLSVPGADREGPVIALEAPREGGAAARLLQGPAPPDVAGELRLSRVDYASGGALSLSGTAAPGATVQLYVDNQPLARVEADAQGTWTATPGAADLEDKVYTLRVDEVAADGAVEQRVELPFRHTNLVADAAAGGETMVVVQPGNNLWRVARAVYGQGIDYTIIYEANTDQIRDPDLIYPGQVFRIPLDQAGAADDAAALPAAE